MAVHRQSSCEAKLTNLSLRPTFQISKVRVYSKIPKAFPIAIRIDFIQLEPRRICHIYWAIGVKKMSQMRIKEVFKDQHLWHLQALLCLKQVWTSPFYSHESSQAVEQMMIPNCYPNKEKGNNRHYLTLWALMLHLKCRILSHPKQCQCSKTQHLSSLKWSGFGVVVLQNPTLRGRCQEESSQN